VTAGCYLVGIDDTDAGSSIGTGALARELALYLERDHDVRPRGITRHQLLVHPDIPYTSHNSSACLELEHEAGPEALGDACQCFLELLFHPGADPGLCVAARTQAAGAAVMDFGLRAQREVVQMSAARDRARAGGILLRELGGSGLGIIGALAACALRAGENDGRFIALGEIRELPDRITVGELRRRTAIAAVQGGDRRPLAEAEVIATGRWIRPTLCAGRILLEVERDAACDCYRPSGRKRGDND
jgi:hypothetical protein